MIAEADSDAKQSKKRASYVQRFNMSVNVPSLAANANSSQRPVDGPSRVLTTSSEHQPPADSKLQEQSNVGTRTTPDPRNQLISRLEESRDRNQSQQLFDAFEEKSAAFDKLAAQAAGQVDDATAPHLSPSLSQNKLLSQTTDLNTSPTPMLRVLAAVEAADAEAAEASKTQHVAPISTEDALVAADKALEAFDDMSDSDRYGLIAAPLECSPRQNESRAAAAAFRKDKQQKRRSFVADASAAAVTMSKGDRVKVFSASANDWLSGVVEEVSDSGEAQVRYRVGS
eukprot:COSAG03_NODE_6476_length_1054_cov_5.017801_1_plen_284_part_10